MARTLTLKSAWRPTVLMAFEKRSRRSCYSVFRERWRKTRHCDNFYSETRRTARRLQVRITSWQNWRGRELIEARPERTRTEPGADPGSVVTEALTVVLGVPVLLALEVEHLHAPDCRAGASRGLGSGDIPAHWPMRWRTRL